MRGTSQGVGAEACFDDLILADVIDGEFVLLFDLDKQFAQFRILERLGGFLDQALLPLAESAARSACPSRIAASLALPADRD